MFLASKVACTGIAFVLLTTGPPALRLTDVASEIADNHAMPTIGQSTDVKATQQKLSDKGHYRGRVDGVFGLRTRASIRGFQKAENLPVTGQLDTQTAGKLGVPPESRMEIALDPTKSKPSARIKWGQDPRRAGKTSRKSIKPDDSPDGLRAGREKSPDHEND